MSPDCVKETILGRFPQALAATGFRVDEVPDDLDLRAAGIVDSLGFVELIAALEHELGCEFDFEGLSSEELTIIGPLSRYIAACTTTSDVHGARLEEMA